MAVARPERVETAPPLTFGVLNQRSPQITAQYWNPILAHVSKVSGVTLQLRMGKTAPETTAMTVRGEFDFAYTNHLFTPERAALGFRVIARPANPGIRGALVTLEQSDVSSVADLAGRTVVFPSREAFVGYKVPLDALIRAGINVDAVFAGNQDGAMETRD
jgi:phosphonate transport system substrate-binding protein